MVLHCEYLLFRRIHFHRTSQPTLHAATVQVANEATVAHCIIQWREIGGVLIVRHSKWRNYYQRRMPQPLPQIRCDELNSYITRIFTSLL